MLVATLAGCGGNSMVESTIRVVVSTDLDVPTTIDNLVISGARGGNVTFTNRYDESHVEALPDSLLLHNGQPRDDQGNEIFTPVRIVVEGYLVDALVIRRSAELTFVTDRPVVLYMPLCASCIPQDCDAEETCKSGECVPEGVSIDALPKDDGTQPAEGPECPATLD